MARWTIASHPLTRPQEARPNSPWAGVWRGHQANAHDIAEAIRSGSPQARRRAMLLVYGGLLLVVISVVGLLLNNGGG